MSDEPRYWGKAGVRLTPQEVAAKARRACSDRERRDAARAESDRIAHEKWRMGLVVPNQITIALNRHDLSGPEVDIACGAREPDVDLWEAGKLYPRWEQILKLADLTDWWPIRFMAPAPQMSPLETSMRFHLRPGETLRIPIYTFSRYALNAAAKWGVTA